MIGKVVGGRYRVLDVLGEGGIAVVYRAEHQGLGRHVALKMLHPVYGEHEELRARFQREAKALAALSHPHIVNMVDYGVEGDMPYLVMELLEGRSLRDLLDEQGTLPPERALAIVRQVLRALIFAHQRGLVHRDLKPGNVFLQQLTDTADHVKILDFGFAKFVAGDQVDQGPALTRAGKVFGTPAYMAPEQVTGGGIDGRADLYACGVLLYEMLAGRRPFEGEVPEMIRAKVLEQAMPLAEARPGVEVHPVLERFLSQALARLDHRFPDAGAMLAALDEVPGACIRPAGVGAATTVAQLERPRSKTPLVLALAAIPVLGILVVCVAAGIFVAASGDDEPEPIPVTVPPLPNADPEPMTVTVEGLAVPDPWSDGEVPPRLAEVREALARGEDVGQETIAELRRHARTERDGRGWLLIGHVYAQRGWRSDAVTTYDLAFRTDASLRGDPQMLANLVALSAHPAVSDEASAAVRRIYGAEALPTVEAALRSPQLRRDGVDRLERLRQRLEQR